MASTTWKTQLRSEIQDRWRIGQAFSLEDVYQLDGVFAPLYPRNKHRFDKLRQTLQLLRDDGFLDFVDNHGTYRRL